jgi:enamine deaminase RidA (YjgF/YER057c/UK114 family)
LGRRLEDGVAGEIARRVAELGLSLPPAAAPAANYVPWVLSDRTLYISGQLPLRDGKLLATGKLGEQVGLEEGRAAARQCALNLLAQLDAAIDGELARLSRCLKLTGFVSAQPGFTDHHKVVNGASDFLVEVLGEAGRHARSAVGVPGLPLDAAVEIEGIFRLV